MKFRITDHVSEQDIQDIHRELKKYNLSKREPSENIPIGAFYEETDGTNLLKSVEAEAVSRGAKYAFVDTFNFQAPAFYRKHGFQEVFKLFDYPYTGARYYNIKQL